MIAGLGFRVLMLGYTAHGSSNGIGRIKAFVEQMLENGKSRGGFEWGDRVILKPRGGGFLALQEQHVALGRGTVSL